jgi:AAA domain-containing protein
MSVLTPITEVASVEKFEPRRRLLLSSWMKREIKPRDYVLGSVLCTTSRWLIFGETGVGKTLLGLEIAGAVAAGAALLNWEGSGKPKRVMYIDGELPEETFKERLTLIADRYGAEIELYAYNRDSLKDGDLPPLNTQEGEKWLWREIDIVKPEAIVFDSIMCLLAGSMSEEESWEPIKTTIRKITGRRIAQIWMHHTGHDNSKGFGTKTREWEMDTVVSLTKADEDGTVLAMEFKKARLRRPETRGQFEARQITRGPNGWEIVEGQVVKSGRTSDLLIVRRGIVDAYNRLADKTKPSHGFDGNPVRKVSVDSIRDEVKSRGLLETKESGGLTDRARTTFARAKADLIASKSHVESEGFFWKL